MIRRLISRTCRQNISFTRPDLHVKYSVTSNTINKAQNETKIDTESAQKKGFKYEEESIATLNNQYNFKVQKTVRQGPGDKGIDFKGTFTVDAEVPIIGQCKRLKKPLSVDSIRELEGVLSHYPQFIGLFVSHSGYSKDAVRHAQQSHTPFILSIIRDNAITYWVMNQKARLLLPTLVPALHRGATGEDKIMLFTNKNGQVTPLL